MKPRQSRTAAYPPRPPRERGTGRAFLLAALMHVLLALFLYHGVHWQNSTPAGAEAELWTSVPDTSTPQPVPTPPVKVAPPPPPVKNEEADIALQQKRREQQAAAAREAQLEEQRRQQLKAQQLAAQKTAEREKQKQAEKLRQQQLAEQQRKIEQQKLEQQKLEQQKKQEQLAAQKKADAEKAEKAAKAAAAAKANAAAKAKLDKERQARLAQLQGIAGGGEGLAKSGTGTGSGGNAASPGYADKVRRRVKPNIVWAGERDSLVTVVAIRCTPSGDVLSTSIRRSSGNSGWDQAVINAIQASVPLPPDTNGRTPSEITITFKAAE
ncbi:cell envelope integrity protein TolA [Burkholderia sp. MSMB1589WGS]|uniref:cell envelope integrity protein TolA n=1 Tax=Burkholderia sp. MSMB1589WGS TaxID=1636425 RepID=UPI0007BA6328|nr:cell envelope integrity protein TolA [Burkholderia sp. MSMB1589WGS]